MALVSCKYCKAKISDRAIYCPKCGKSTTEGNLNIFNSYFRLWKRAFDFKGISGRKEFWLGQLLSLMISSILLFFIALNHDKDFEEVAFLVVPYMIHIIGTSYASISLFVRRFRDTATKPIGVVLFLIPVIGQIYVLAVCCKKSKR